MASLFYTLDLLEIGRHKLNLNEYLTLLKFQHDSEDRSFPFDPDPRYFERLLRDNFLETNGAKAWKLGPEGIKLFKGDDDLFEEFYKTFPNKVQTNIGFRPVSTLDPDGISAKTTHGIWNRIVKNKPNLQRRIIDNLKRELEYRKSDGSLAYLQGIDTWLRQATWEKWDDIPDKRSSNNNYVKL